MANREILVSVDDFEKRVVILEDSRLAEFYLQRSTQRQVAGNIYKGKVAQIVKGMEAAFVDLALEKNGFLYIEELLPETLLEGYETELPDEEREKKSGPRPSIEQLLHKGQEVLVQVVKEPFGTKGCRLSSQISLPGRFLVLMPHSANIGISKRITAEKERARLRSLLREIGLPKDIGCIIRTQAEGLEKKDMKRELHYLLQVWYTLKKRAAKTAAPSLVHEESDLIVRIARDIFSQNFAHILIDGKEEFKKIMAFFRALAPELRDRIKFYREKMPLFEKYDVEQQIENIFAPQVQLKRGGYVVIERTEALISIDVNSGKFVDRGRLEDTAFLTNMEAAPEIARQIMLRDLAGIIVIDFIDMQDTAHQRKVLQALSKSLENDKARSTIYPFSPLGLVQIARQRVRKTTESIMFEDCACCHGLGKLKSGETVAIAVLRKIREALRAHRRRQMQVSVHPGTATRLFNEERQAITNLERKFWVRISIIADEHLGIEEIKIV
ncbi:MAG: Rne/Rng family ribonuclease [Candidatus Omnitrophica bacterium]|nr:Rne/Rng family ribonuclease [Candidatus Omnitrophota bacterium]